MPETVSTSIDVEAPLSTVYNQWTQFERFPEFMQAVERIEQLDDTTQWWVVRIGGIERAFEARIIEQVPDERIAWASVDERMHVGQVTFSIAPDGRTRIDLTMEWEPETLLEKTGGMLDLDDLQARMDLGRFKRFIEDRGTETGGWRGEIHDGVTADHQNENPGTPPVWPAV